MNNHAMVSMVSGLYLLALGTGIPVQAAPISWSTPSGFVRTNGTTPLLESGSALFQLIHSDDEIANSPAGGGSTSGDDVLLDQKTADSSTAGAYGQHFAATCTNNYQYGYFYVRVFDVGSSPGNVPGGTAHCSGLFVPATNYMGLPNPNPVVSEGPFAGGLSADGMGHYILGYAGAPLGEAVDALTWVVLLAMALVGWTTTFIIFALTRRRIVHYL